MLHDPITRAEILQARLDPMSDSQLLATALKTPEAGRIALVSSFGADSVVLLHLVAGVRPDLPVLFLDTLMLFPETLAYQRELAKSLGLSDIRVITPDREALFAHDPDALMHRANPDACCALRKTAPLEAALSGFDTWITGRKRFQAGTREALTRVEVERDTGRLRLNPLADWSASDISDYITAHDLPRHPLVTRGYPSIGCMPCTSRVRAGEDARAGRWRGQDKTECGIHFIGGVAQRKENAA